MNKFSLLAALAASSVLPSLARAADAPAVEMKLLEKDAMKKMGGYRPQPLKLSSEKPAEIKKSPEVTHAMYGKLHFGDKEIAIIVDEPEGKDASIYVDSNANGDLTDDAPVKWQKHEYQGREGAKYAQYMGMIQVPLQVGDKQTLVSLGAYRFDPRDTMRAAIKDVLLYYVDYAMEGKITFAGKSHTALLIDDAASGDFRGKENGQPGASSPRLLIDLNDDGKFDFRSETFDSKKPFNVGGTTWQVADMQGGGTFKLEQAKEKVAEIPLPPNLSVGQKAVAFNAKRTDGAEVKFPADYKGKLVMLDFWATWCGPCMGEVPNLVKTYNEVHPKGVEILGISLDQPNSTDKLKKVTEEKGMTWPQVYDGKFWEAEVAMKYGIQAIPAAFLVDGDTGEIVAEGTSLRGEELAKTLAAAMEKKQKAEK